MERLICFVVVVVVVVVKMDECYIKNI